MSLHWDTKWIEFSPHGGHGVDKKGWRNLVSGLQPGFGNDDSKDFYQLLFLSFFRGQSYVVKENGHALGWQLKGRSGLATLLRVPVDIKRGTETPALVRLQEIQVLPDANQNFADLPSSISLTFSGPTRFVNPQDIPFSFLASPHSSLFTARCYVVTAAVTTSKV